MRVCSLCKISSNFTLYLIKVSLKSESSNDSRKFQVTWKRHLKTWNFLESFQLSDFNEMQRKVTWDFT